MDIEQLHKEVSYTAVASSGPGGQHANKVATKVLLEFDIENSTAFAKGEHSRILEALQGQLTKENLLKISCQESRSQAKNKELAFAKLVKLLKKSATPKKVRRKRVVPASVKRKRLNDNKKHSEKKANRRFKP
ncbi:alternative ribosome rescue aminoacyl-tRNA hydrolase ArfB [Nonlabens antarcticus]|uniref:alternative ribosome rescue aminoacyl-tRNA hydrolase ArfB n=1 Tax=Nonlabens antarcticus TaxID=392714 RepID=UPI0018918107|nr:alternative ribosome rescue aminoacyl-tRNA hydrolase ArfB [Nonlabens antarcticus]